MGGGGGGGGYGVKCQRGMVCRRDRIGVVKGTLTAVVVVGIGLELNYVESGHAGTGGRRGAGKGAIRRLASRVRPSAVAD